MIGLPVFGLSLIFAIAMCVHVVRTNQSMLWLWAILVLQPFAGIVYFVAIVLPSLMGGPTARKAREAARETLDPTRDYRQAKAAVDDSPTVHNRMRLAAAAGELGRWDEAEALYREAAQGVHAEDPTLMLGLAHARVELGRYDEALPILTKLSAAGDPARAPQIALLLGRVYEGLGRTSEADEAYRTGGMRLPGLEGIARYAAFLGRTGRTAEARDLLAEIDRRVDRTNHRFMKEARAWRELAARGVEGR